MSLSDDKDRVNRPGPQPHNQIGTYEEQLTRAAKAKRDPSATFDSPIHQHLYQTQLVAEAAEGLAWKAQVEGNKEAAEILEYLRREANGDVYREESMLAAVEMLLLRLAQRHHSEAIRDLLLDLLRPAFENVETKINDLAEYVLDREEMIGGGK
jgi:hypothetical protein